LLAGSPSETPAVSYRFLLGHMQSHQHNLCCEDVGTVTKIILPHDIPTFPLIAAKMVLGVSAISHSGAESEITTVIADI